MTHRAATCRLLLLGLGGSVLALAPPDAAAGQLKTLSTATLGPGGQVQAYSSPKNSGLAMAMEMEVYEWQAAPAGGTWRCQVYNSAGQALNLRLIGLAGDPAGGCTAPSGGSCVTGPITASANAKYLCLVATRDGSPIPNDTAVYRIFVQRLNY